jgi:FkbM family methyltransferase
MNIPTRYKLIGARMLHRVVKAGRQVRGRPMDDTFSRKGLRWHLDLNEGIDFAIYLLGYFEPELVKFYASRIRPGDVVLDIGANIGAHTLPLARLVGPDGKVVAVEATQYAFDKLSRNIALNPTLRTQITPIHALLTRDGTTGTAKAITSSWPLDRRADDPLLEGGVLKQTQAAKSVSVDQLAADLKLASINWIKIDVDGHETEVLAGATAVLSSRPNILIELAPYCHAPGSFEELLHLLFSHGYSFQDLQNMRPLPRDVGSVKSAIPTRGSINVLATASA